MRLHRLIAVCAGLALFAQACLPSSYRRSQELMQSKDFEGAVKALEEADREKSGNDDIKAALKVARSSAAQGRVARAEGRAAEDLWGKFDDLDAARQYQPGDSKIDAALAEVELAERGVQKLVDLAFDELNKGDPEAAYEAFQKVAAHVKFSKELQEGERTITREYARVHIGKGHAEIEAGRTDEAAPHFEAALKARPGSTRAHAGVKALEGQGKLVAEDFKGAMDCFAEAVRFDGKFGFAQQRLVVARRALLAQYLRDGKEAYEVARYPDEIVQAMEPMMAAVSFGLEGDPERAEASQRLQLLRSRLASVFVRTAGEAMSNGRDGRAATALHSYRAAHMLDPEATASLEPFAARALAAFDEKVKLKVAVHFQDELGDSAGLDKLLHDQLVAALEQSGIPGIAIVSPEHLKDVMIDEKSLAQGFAEEDAPKLNLGAADLVVLGKVVKASVEDQGRDTPLSLTSRFVASTHEVHNDEYDDAERRVESARESLAQAERQYEIQKQQIQESANKSAGTGLFGAILIGAAAGLNEAGVIAARSNVRDAENKLARTPQTVEEKVIESYSYEEFHVQVDADLQASLHLFDRRAQAPIANEVVVAQLKKTGLMRQGVESTDQGGLTNVDGPLPDPDAVRAEAQAQLARELAQKVIARLRPHRTERFAMAARAAREAQRDDDAVENAILYLETTQGEDPAAAELEELTYKAALLSRHNRKLEHYRAPTATDAVWPAVKQ